MKELIPLGKILPNAVGSSIVKCAEKFGHEIVDLQARTNAVPLLSQPTRLAHL